MKSSGFSFRFVFSFLLLSILSIDCKTTTVNLVSLFEEGKIVRASIPISEFIDDGATTFIIVRHAEKRKDSNDPALTKEGLQRAKILSGILKKTRLGAIYSSDYKRTRQTAKSTIESQSSTLPLKIYNPRDLPGFVETAMAAHPAENILVVGHSNSSPTLVNELIGAEAFAEIPETDYDNLFVVNVDKEGEAKAVHLKFGEGE